MSSDPTGRWMKATSAPSGDTVAPERLYRPDVSITEWRKLVDETARGEPIREAYRPTIAGLRNLGFELTGSASEENAIA
jgi:hypothetical protein